MTRSALEKFIGTLGLADEGGKGTQVLKLDEIQAQAILDMRLHRLTGLEREKIVAEFKEVLALIAKLREILGSEKLVLEIIVDELQQIKKQFGDERRTEIVAEASDIDIEDLIVEEDMVITVSRGGYIKRSPLSLYRAQRRGGKGRIGATTKEEDLVEHLFVASTHAYVLAFTSRGRMHWIKVYDIPQLGPATRGKAIVNLLALSPERAHGRDGRDEGLSGGPLPHVRDAEGAGQEDGALGLLERALGRHHRDQPRGGRLAALGADHGGDDQIFIGTRQGMGIRFSEKDVRAMGRDTTGVIGVSLEEEQRRGRRDGRRRREGAPALRHGDTATASARR